MSDNPTLETLESKLQRLIEEWKIAAEKTEMIVNPTPDEKLAEFVALHPELLTATAPPAHYSPDGLEGALIPQLLALPDKIRQLQEAFDAADWQYQYSLTNLSIRALSIKLFKGKEEGTLRPASNEVERDLAIAKLTRDDIGFGDFTDVREKALADLQQAKTRLECARLIIQMLCRETKR